MIKKWALPVRGVAEVPTGRVLAAAEQDHQIVCWTEDLAIDTDGRIKVETVFTGDDKPQHMDHVDTVLTDSGIVVHVYCDAGWSK